VRFFGTAKSPFSSLGLMLFRKYISGEYCKVSTLFISFIDFQALELACFINKKVKL